MDEPQQRRRTRLLGQLGSFDGSRYPGEPVTVGTRRVSAVFCLLFFGVLGLALLPMVSNVQTTVQYGGAWIIGYGALMLAVAVSTWKLRRVQQMRLRTFFALFIGFAALAAGAVFGGVPILAHYATAHPGEMIVTVSAKQTDYQRSACSPRLIIREFTFRLSNHLCPSAQTFAQIAVGSSIRLEGQVSPFGVSIHRYYWTH